METLNEAIEKAARGEPLTPMEQAFAWGWAQGQLPVKQESRVYAALDNCRKMLRRVQWAATDSQETPECPICGTAKPYDGEAGGGDHRDDCELAALL